MVPEEVVEAVDVSLTTVSALMDSVAVLIGLSMGSFAELSGVAEGTGPWFSFRSKIWTESCVFTSDFVSPADVVDMIFGLETSGFEAEPFATG